MELVGVPQQQLGVRIDLQQQRNLQQGIGEEEVREKARLSSLTLPHAGDWLNTAPLTALGLHLRQAEFVLVAKYRLGLKVYERDGPCPGCLRHSDCLGDHALSCGTGRERISRHNHLGMLYTRRQWQLGWAPPRRAGSSFLELTGVL